jgi:hypothetical protein
MTFFPSFIGEVQRYLVVVLATSSLKLVVKVIPPNALLNSQLIQHNNLMYNLL